MGPYGTIQHCVNGTRCSSHNNKWNNPLSHVYGTSQHLAIQTNKRYNTYFTIIQIQLLIIRQLSEMHSYNITVITHVYA